MLTNMNGKTFRIIIAYILVIACKEIAYIRGHHCTLHGKKTELRANCKNRYLSNIPSNLDSNVRYLDVSKNKLLHLTDFSFSHLPFLIALEIQDSELGTNITENVFSNLQWLEYLDLSNTVIHNRTIQFKWPLNLYVLKVIRLGERTLNLSNLANLQELHASSNNLSMFPLFHSKVPLSHLSLDWNSEINVSVEILAPFHKLRYFSFEQKQHHEICSSQNYCQYIRLKRWMRDCHIMGSLPKCPNIKGQTCNTTFSAELVAGRIKRQRPGDESTTTLKIPHMPRREQSIFKYVLEFIVNYILKQIFLYIFIFIVLPFIILIACVVGICFYVRLLMKKREHDRRRESTETNGEDLPE